MLTDDSKKEIKNLFNITKKLKASGIIRSTKVFSDVSEYLCKEHLKLKLSESQRQEGFDAVDGRRKKYQIKFNNSKEKTNQDIGNPGKYDYLLLVITNESKLFDTNRTGFICIYRIEASELIGKKYIAKTYIAELKPILELDKNLDLIPNMRRD